VVRDLAILKRHTIIVLTKVSPQPKIIGIVLMNYFVDRNRRWSKWGMALVATTTTTIHSHLVQVLIVVIVFVVTNQSCFDEPVHCDDRYLNLQLSRETKEQLEAHCRSIASLQQSCSRIFFDTFQTHLWSRLDSFMVIVSTRLRYQEDDASILLAPEVLALKSIMETTLE